MNCCNFRKAMLSVDSGVSPGNQFVKSDASTRKEARAGLSRVKGGVKAGVPLCLESLRTLHLCKKPMLSCLRT